MAQYLNAFSGRQFIDANGAPYVGAKLFIYAAGSSTKVTTTKDSAGAANHLNPIILNARGEPADAAGASQAIWQTGGSATKLVLAPSNDTDPPVSAISSWDNLSGINDTSVTIDQWITGPAPTFVSGTQFTLVGDQTTNFHVGRRIKATVTAGTVYGVITVSAFTTLTTITVVLDSGALDSGLSAIAYGILTSVSTSIPGVKMSGADWTHTGKVTHTDVLNMSAKSFWMSEGASVASASTCNIWTTDGNTLHVTGSTTINGWGTAPQAGARKLVIFDSTPQLNFNATTNDTNTNASNFTVSAGDVAEVYARTTSSFKVTIFKYNGLTNILIPTSGIATGAVTQTILANASVGQAQLKTSSSQVSTTATRAQLTLPGGQYGLYPRLNTSGAGVQFASIGPTADTNDTTVTYATLLVNGTTLTSYINLGTSSGTITADQVYIQASPPYSLGDGDIPLFIFLEIDTLGRIVSSYVAPEAPWHYNGPTDIRALFYRDGKSFQHKKKFLIEHGSLENAVKKGISYEKAIDDMFLSPMVDVEITQSIKNADFGIIPHPFGSRSKDNTVVLIDPVSNLCEKLCILHESGESIATLLHGGHLMLGDEVNRARPQGVKTYSCKWKKT